MVKFNLRKMFAVGLLSATAAFAGVAAMQGAPSVVAYAEETTTPEEGQDKLAVTGYASFGDYGTELRISPIGLRGSYIYVDYYTDEDCTKLKATFTYTKDEASRISLGNLSLKKGGYFKVYDEIIGVDKVEKIEIAPQVEKIKVKVVDISKDTLLEALSITVGSTSITADNAKEYRIFIGYTPLTEDGKVNEAILTNLKIGARAAGLTVMVQYAGKVAKEGEEVLAMGTEAKVKIPAAAKAPKVVIDYVNGTYTIPKGSNYYITSVAEDGTINLPDEEAKPVEATAKTPLTVDEILKASVAENAEMPKSAAIIVYTTKAKKMDSMQAVMTVKALDALSEPEVTSTDEKKAKNDKASVKLGETEVASLVFSADGVVIEAKAANGIAYYNEATKKWVVVKNGAKTKGVVALKNDGKAELQIKVLGKKASKGVDPEFGSAILSITNSYEEVKEPETTPTPTPTPDPAAPAA